MADLTMTWAFSSLVDAAKEAHEIGQKQGYVEGHRWVQEVLLPHCEAQGWDPAFMDGVRDAAHYTFYGDYYNAVENDPTTPRCVTNESDFDQAPLVTLYDWLIEQGRQPGRVLVARSIAEMVREAGEQFDTEEEEAQSARDEWEGEVEEWETEVAEFDADPANDPDDRPEKPEEPEAASPQYRDGSRYVLQAIQEVYGITDEDVEE